MALCDEKCCTFGSHGQRLFSGSVCNSAVEVVRHGFDVKSCCGLPGHERKKNSVVYARSSRDRLPNRTKLRARVPGLWTSSAGR